jgi:mannosyl-3-phosphoglycerate phosphatase
MPKFVFFSDLDGSLLDFNTYSFEEARPALIRIKQTESALVLSTSKTRAEVMEYEREMGIDEPTIVENGGAIFVPKDYFQHEIKDAVEYGRHLMVRIGAEAKELERLVDELGKRFGVRPLHRMGVEELMNETGLDKGQALLAKDRHFSASFRTPDKETLEKARQFVEQKGYDFSEGARFCAVMRGTDKGLAVRILLENYRKEFPGIVSVGLGDEENDFGMLKACDKAFLVARPDGSYASEEFEKAPGIGPAGWKKAVLEVLRHA